MSQSPKQIERRLSESELEAAIETARRDDDDRFVRRLRLIKQLYEGTRFDEAVDRLGIAPSEAERWIEDWNDGGIEGLRESRIDLIPDGGNEVRGQRGDYEGGLPAETWFKELDAAVIEEDRCVQCASCVAACPVDTIGITDGKPTLEKMCIGCSRCWDFCPRGGLRYERQWTVTGGEDNVDGAGDPITEFSAKTESGWRDRAQDGGVVTAMLVRLLETDAIDGAIIATESDEDPWKAEPFIATTAEECIENAGSFYNQTMSYGHLDYRELEELFPEADTRDLSLALVGTPCVIEGVRALQDHDWEYGSHEDTVRAIDYTIALMCTKNFEYDALMRDQLEGEYGIDLEAVGKLDVIHGDMIVYDEDGTEILREDIEEFHEAALSGCAECADFTGYCADVSVGSVGSADEYSSVIIRTETGMDAWQTTESELDYHDLEEPAAIGKLQSWDKREAFESLQRSFDAEASRFIPYTDHAHDYGVDPNPRDPSVKGEPSSQ